MSDPNATRGYEQPPQPDEKGELYVARDVRLLRPPGEFQRADEALLAGWVLGGMQGRPVRRGHAPLAIEPGATGEWVIREYA